MPQKQGENRLNFDIDTCATRDAQCSPKHVIELSHQAEIEFVAPAERDNPAGNAHTLWQCRSPVGARRQLQECGTRANYKLQDDVLLLWHLQRSSILRLSCLPTHAPTDSWCHLLTYVFTLPSVCLTLCIAWLRAELATMDPAAGAQPFACTFCILLQNQQHM